MLTVITGGHGSGKTAKALATAALYPSKVYIATAEPIDDEMRSKIAIHKAERDESYLTVEESLNLPSAVVNASADVIIIDCITVWINNLLYHNADMEKMTAELMLALDKIRTDCIVITNESSLSLIPADAMSRRYLKGLSNINKLLAQKADSVCLMVSGLPVWLKGIQEH